MNNSAMLKERNIVTDIFSWIFHVFFFSELPRRSHKFFKRQMYFLILVEFSFSTLVFYFVHNFVSLVSVFFIVGSRNE